jgi:hypothetical protein
VNEDVTTITPKHSDNWKRARDMPRGVVLYAVPYCKKTFLTFGEHPIRNTGTNNETRGKFCDGLGSNIVAELLQEVRGQVG